MLSPRAVPMIVRHFDAVDKVVSSRMIRSRPWLETALTSLLCDVLDAETQREINVDYTVDQLNRNLAEPDGVLAVSFSVETHEYGPDLERWVTQADLGFVVEYEDFLLPHESRTVGWLLQAKRLTPDQRNPLSYSEASKFSGMDAAQKHRIERLRQIVGVDFVRYLLYCPRPDRLETLTRAKLAHLRTSALSTDIFDYAVGLALREDLMNSHSTLAAGLFVSSIDRVPRNLADVHRSVLSSVLPLSWFFVQHLAPYRDGLINRRLRSSASHRPDEEPSDDCEDWVLGIVRGDRAAIERLLNGQNMPINEPFTILPRHTITVSVTAGANFDPDNRRIRID